MAMSNSERQAAYRARHLKDEGGTGERLNLVVDLHAKRALERLAVCYGVTQRVMMERILLDAERRALIEAEPTGCTEYYEGRLRLGSVTPLHSSQTQQASQDLSTDGR